MKGLIEFQSNFNILRGRRISLVLSTLISSYTLSLASPSGGIVTSGSATINQNGNVTNINQITNKATINWQNFSIGKDETVNFNQPNINSVTLNRVVGNEKSIIDGALNANGQIWLLNSNGVLFGKNAAINTSGILATTAELSDQDFNDNNYNFKNSTNKTIINQGLINISNNGSIIFASNEVNNEGTITAVKGKIHLVGANSYSINLNGNSLINLTIDKGVLDSMVSNSGTINADGGEIYLTTNAVDELLNGVVNNTGIIEANDIDDLTGYVELFAHGGTAKIGGTLTANKGFIETSGKYYTFLGADIKAGQWLIDPINITIDTTLASAIQTALEGGDVTITTDGSNTPDTSSGESGTDGNITVNSDITWSTAQKLTLSAARNIYILANITATNSAGQVQLNYGQDSISSGNNASYNFGLSSYGYTGSINLQAGDNFFTKLGNDGSINTWKVITSLGNEGSTSGTDLQGINGNLSGNFVLGSDINASNTSTWNSNTGWTALGDATTKFTGNFNGLGHTISNLFINKVADYQGLFGYIENATVENVGLKDVNITANSAVAAISGTTQNSTINKSFATGSVAGVDSIGGITGSMASNSNINQSYSTVNINGSQYLGSLVGRSHSSNINNSYATGNVTTSSSSNAYAGGLLGYLESGSTIINSYALGTLQTGITLVGGLTGDSNGVVTVTNSYWNDETSGVQVSANGLNYKTAQMQTLSTFTSASWDMTGADGFYPIFNNTNGSIWYMGTLSKPDTTTPYNPSSSSNSNSTNNSLASSAQNIITPIINNIFLPNPPRIINKNYLYKELENQNNFGQVYSNLITLKELKEKETQKKFTKIPVRSSSNIILVNGGLNLPNGLEQMVFFPNSN